MQSEASISPIHVAAAAVFDDQGRVFIARRPDHAHQGGRALRCGQERAG